MTPNLTGLTEQEIKDVRRGPAHYVMDPPSKRWKENHKERIKRLQYAATLRIPHLPELLPHEGVCAVVGAAPTVTQHLGQIRAIQRNEFNVVMPLNGAHALLLKHDIVPSIQVLFELDEPTPEDIMGSKPHPGVTYYICSHCHKGVFTGLEGYTRVLWHCFDEPPEYQKTITTLFPKEFMVGGGHVTFFRVINIAILLGYRKFELFGCDASFSGDRSHFEGYHSNYQEPQFEVLAGGEGLPLKRFRTNPSLSFLAHEFMKFCEVQHGGLSIKVHGNGLLRHLHEQIYPEQYQT